MPQWQKSLEQVELKRTLKNCNQSVKVILSFTRIDEASLRRWFAAHRQKRLIVADLESFYTSGWYAWQRAKHGACSRILKLRIRLRWLRSEPLALLDLIARQLRRPFQS